jgi:flagellar basal-body rod protein FlgB
MTELNVIAGSATSALVLRGLDAAALRHTAVASNIANVSNSQYQPLRVNFEEQLTMLRGELLRRGDDAAVRRALGSVAARIEPDLSHAGDVAHKIQLDEEISKMMQNAIYYQSLLVAQGKNGSIVRMAIREGRS